MNNFLLAAVLISVGVGCLFGGLIAALVSFFMSKASAEKITEVINVATDQAEDLRAEVVKLRQAIVALTDAVDELLASSPGEHMDPDAAWNLTMVNRTTKLAMR